MNTARTQRAVAAGASFLALATLSACGAIGDLMPGKDPFLDQSPRSMAKASFADMQDVTSMRILGSLELKDHGFTRVDIRLDDTSCSATFDVRDGTMRVLKNAQGEWFSADQDFWRANAGTSPQADQVVRRYAGRWAVLEPRDKEIRRLCDLGAFLDAFALDKNDTDDTIAVGEVVEVGDADAVPLTAGRGKDRTTIWASLDGPHRVLKMAPARDTGRPDALYFEEFGVDVVVETPEKKDIFELPRMESPV